MDAAPATALGSCTAAGGLRCAQGTAQLAVVPAAALHPHDGVAVVNQPDGYGLHIYLETDTSFPGVCRPRWLPDPARLFNGNGSTPFSSGLATREEFFDAVARRDVRGLLKSELKALCQARAPEDRWQWIEPPRNDNQVVPVQLPSLEEEDLLTNPVEELKRARQLLRDQRAGE